MERGLVERMRDAGRASPAETVMLVLVALAIVGGSLLVFVRRSEPPPPPMERSRAAREAEGAPDPDASPPAKKVLVHVSGLVSAPGVYELAHDSRVQDAIAAAGGPRDGGDIEALNLAAPLSDGQKIIVARPGEPAASQPALLDGAAASPGPSGKINLNTASAAELDALPSIGPVIAERILVFRQQKGRFTSVAQLRDVEGIGPKKYEGVKDLVTV
jgi:competence protein ComEA